MITLDKKPKLEKNVAYQVISEVEHFQLLDFQYHQNKKVMIGYWEPLLTSESADHVLIRQGQDQGQSGVALSKVLPWKNQVVGTSGHSWKKTNLL